MQCELLLLEVRICFLSTMASWFEYSNGTNRITQARGKAFLAIPVNLTIQVASIRFGNTDLPTLQTL